VSKDVGGKTQKTEVTDNENELELNENEEDDL